MLRTSAMLVVLLGLAHVRAQDPLHRRFTTADGLPSDVVYCFTEDREGLMWFGTDAGAARFDGVRFETFTPSDGLTDIEIIGIEEDRSGRVWMLTLNGALCFYSEGGFHHAGNTPWLKGSGGSSGWHSFAEAGDGTLWFAGIRGEVVAVKPGEGVVHRIAADGRLRSLFTDEQGRVHHVVQSVVWRWEGKALVRVDTIRANGMAMSVRPCVDIPGQATLLAEEGVLLFQQGRPRDVVWTRGRVDPDRHVRLHSIDTTDMWFIGRRSGVEHHRALQERPVDWFMRDRITTMYTTKAGDHWFGTRSGGALLVAGRFSERTQVIAAEGSGDGGVVSLSWAHGAFWAGTDMGTILRVTSDGVRLVRPGDAIRYPGRVLQVLEDGRSDLWVLADHGLYRAPAMGEGLWQQVLLPAVQGRPGGPFAAKRAVVRGNGRLWAVGNGLCAVGSSDAGLHAVQQSPDQLLRERIQCLAEDASGVLWLGVGDRLIRVTNEVVETVHLNDRLRGSRITSILPLTGDTLLVGTAGAGLLVFGPGGRASMLGAGDGLMSEVIRGLSRSGDTIWYATPRGAGALILRAGRVVDSWSWSVDNGLPSSDVRDVLQHSGVLMVATAHGLCVLPPRLQGDDGGSHRLRPFRVEVNGHVHHWPTEPLLLREGDRLQVEHHLVEFALAKAVVYEYRTGSVGWYPCAQGRVVLDGLSEGARILQVRARLPEGDWVLSAPVHYIVHPPWHKRTSTRAMASLLLSVSVLLGFRWRQRRLARAHRHAMEKAVALNEERRRIAADIHDDLGAELSHLLMRSRGGVESAGLTEGLERAIGRIDEVIWSLDPSKDTVLGTIRFIETWSVQYIRQAGLRAQIRSATEIPGTAISALTRRNLLLAVKEAMRNVVRHARATQVEISWTIGDGILQVAIQDDGVGSDDSHLGRGTRNMHDRMTALGGRMLRMCPPSGGTRVEFQVPLSPSSS